MSIPSIPVQTPHPVDRTECTRSRHSGAGQPNRLDGLLSLAEVIPAGSLGVGKRLPDDVVKFRVHAGMKARPKPKEKPARALADALAAGRDYLSQTEEAIQVRLARPRMTALGALSAVNRVRRLDRDRGN